MSAKNLAIAFAVAVAAAVVADMVIRAMKEN